jgi:hypothetical protein
MKAADMMERMKKISTLVLLIMISGVLVGCNRPGGAPSTEPPPEAVFTTVAETVVAEYTAIADSQSSGDDPEVSNTPAPPTSEPSDTPEPTSTPTSTPTETPTPTSTDIVGAIYEDDFSSETGWFTADEDNFIYEFTDGGYRMFNNVLNAGYWSVRYQTYDDIRLDVDVTRLGGPNDGYYGVVCRFGDDGEDYYALVINDTGFYGILKYENGEIDFLASGLDDREKINRGLGEKNRISGVCSGDRLTLFANDHHLAEVFDETFTTGDIGLIVFNRLSGVGIDVLFDNFAIFYP